MCMLAGNISQEELRLSFAKYDFAALSLALGLDSLPSRKAE